MKEDRNIFLVVGAVVILLLTTTFSAVGTKTVSSDVNNDVFEITYIDESKINIELNQPAFEFSTIYKNGENFAEIGIKNEGYTTVIGGAKLPIIRRMIEIPYGATPQIETLSVSWETTSLDELGLAERIVPVQPSVVKLPGASQDFVISNEYYANCAFTPENTANVVETNEIRSQRFALIEVAPVKYNPVTGEVMLMTSCELKVNLIGSNLDQTIQNIERYSSPAFEDLFKTSFVNYGYYEDLAGNPKRTEGYLIIVYTDFSDEIQTLATWKEGKGFDVTVTTTSDIPGGATKENIKAYIVDAYNNWPTPPSYVLLVGDTAQIPTWTGSDTGTCTDLYYVTIDSGNYFADIIISRFPAATADQVTTMVGKTIYYETGSFPDSSWIKKAAFLASTDNHLVSEGTHNYIIDTYLIPNGYTCDKIYSYYSGNTTQKVIDALNNGRSLCIYSGHGSTTSWGDGPPFSQSNVNSLTNDGMYPFVASHSCLTNQFTVSECFGETWVRAANKGGVAFWGATTYSYWDEDDILEKGMFQAWWVDNIETIGGMTNKGLYYLYQYYGGGGMSQYYFEEYNVLGDSSVKIWRNNPSPPPETPDTPAGPTDGIWFVEYTFYTKTTEPEGDQVWYMWDWDDGTYSDWLGPYNSGQTMSASHTWTELGTYEVRVKAKDSYGAESPWSDPIIVVITDNNPPNAPTIDGSTKIKPLKEYLYTINTVDPEGQDIKLYIDWGDGNAASGLGPYRSGEDVPMNHAWNAKGTYTIKVKATDTAGGESEWTTLDITVSMSRSRGINNPLILRLLEHFPNAFPILRMLSTI